MLAAMRFARGQFLEKNSRNSEIYDARHKDFASTAVAISMQTLFLAAENAAEQGHSGADGTAPEQALVSGVVLPASAVRPGRQMAETLPTGQSSARSNASGPAPEHCAVLRNQACRR